MTNSTAYNLVEGSEFAFYLLIGNNLLDMHDVGKLSDGEWSCQELGGHVACVGLYIR